MKTRIDEILEEQKKLSEELALIQEQCSHPTFCREVEHGSSSGYAEPDRFWRYVTCKLCLKWWREED